MTIPAPAPQPYLHELTSCVRAPTVVLSAPDGQIRAGGAQGLFHHDRRIVAELLVDVDGEEPVPVGGDQPATGSARFVAVVRHIGDPGADPTVRLERERHARPDGLTERFALVNASHRPISATVRVRAAVDFAAMDAVKHGGHTVAAPPRPAAPGTVRWAGGSTRATLRASGEPELRVVGRQLRAAWQVTVPPRRRWTAALTVTAAPEHPDPAHTFEPATSESAATGPGRRRVSVAGPPDLDRLIERGATDLAALTLTDPHSATDVFLAAGSPWFLTLFGRDSLWAARFALPLGTELARGTLRTLARRQGTHHDPVTTQGPGKIPHEIRSPEMEFDGLPRVYYGNIDATALWVCLLHDAWRWGMPAAEVTALLPPLEAALRWLMRDADPDGDGFLEYHDLTGHGLANQGWKDSGDSVQFPDGTLATPPIALSEAQAYAHQAALSAAALLDAFDRPGAVAARGWAGRLRERFREAFWVRDHRGRFPAIALEGAKRPVDTAASNLGHLLGSGLLTPAESGAVAARLGQPDLDCGYGLRTMSSDAVGFNPLGYHAGSVWPHDTAIAVQGLASAGHPRVASSLATGLLRAAPAFGHRFPELFASTDARAGEAVLAYPAACRPQAWSAAASLALLQAALGLTADVPNWTLTVRPRPEFAAWFPLRVRNLRLAGHPLAISVDAAGEPQVETTAPVTIQC